jgi:hypothetical protein
LTYKLDTPPLGYTLLVLSILVFGVANSNAQACTKQLNVNLYGHQLFFNAIPRLTQTEAICFSEKNIAKEVDQMMVVKETDLLIEQLNEYAEELKMDDIAYLCMLNKVTNVLLPSESDDCKTLFKYVILQKKGFDVFIGFTESSITLYGRTNIMIDNCIYIERGPKKYFDLSFNQKRVPKAEQLFVIHYKGKCLPIVMNVIAPPLFNAKQNKKIFPFEHDGFMYFFTAKVNQSLVEYYKDLPSINISTVYLNYGLSKSATETLIAEMKQAVYPMSINAGLNFILQFVQKSFEYRKDEIVYGQEKFSFPEETLINNFSDCEDKAMLYALLVNKVFGLKTVALYYKDAQHINIAVESWDKDNKGNFAFNNHNYIICEPSGNGFAIGESATSISYANLIDW